MINLYDRTSIMKSIDDHSRLIQRYQQAGYLAVMKLLEKFKNCDSVTKKS